MDFKTLLIPLLVTGGIPLLISGMVLIFARILPKEQAEIKGRIIGGNIYLWMDRFGNSKLGEKAMDKLEEGPIVTVATFLWAIFQQIIDNVKMDKED